MTKLYFTKDHEWLRMQAGIATVGITEHAQEQLGDLVFVDLPQVGQKIKQGDTLVVVESVKAASDVYAPLDGEVVEVNEALSQDPSLVNGDAQGAGWLWKMKIDDEGQLADLLDETGYQSLIG